MMAAQNSRKFTVELYGILPSVVALLCLAIIHNIYFPAWISFALLALLALGALAVSHDAPLALVGVFVLLDKWYFNHPLTGYIGAVLIGGLLLLKAEKSRQPVLLNIVLVLLGVGLVPTLYPPLTGPLCILLGIVACFGFFPMLGMRGGYQAPANPVAYLAPDLPNNQYRFSLFCLAFLAFGSLTWGYLVQHLPSTGLAALAHLVLSLMTVSMVLNAFGLEALHPGELAILKSQQEHLLAELVQTQQQIAELQTSSTSLAVHRSTQLANVNRELAHRQESVSQQIEAQLMKANQELEEDIALRKRRADAELEAVYYRQPWDMLTAHLCNKDSVTIPGGPTLSTRDHLFLGVRKAAADQGHSLEPVFIPKEILHEHVHILGGTGSGKTSLGINPIAIQLLRQNPPSPIIFLDLKGDQATFHTAREEAERNNQDFLFFTIESNKATFRFNPFIGIKKYGGNTNEQAQPILDALGLNHGEGYGRSFFTRIHRQRLLEALRLHPNIHTFAQLKSALKEVPGTTGRQQGAINSQKDELIAAIEGISDYPQLFTTAEEEQNGSGIIQFDKVFEKNQVVYFWIPAPTQSISAREVGKLVLYNLFFAALKRKNDGQLKQAYLLIDEFQKLIGENLAMFLEQCRSFGISLVLTNQNIEQLNTHDAKLWPLVQSNVRASLHFGSGDPKEIELLSKASGEIVSTLNSFSQGNSKGASRGKSRTTTEGNTTTDTWGTSESVGKSSGTSENFQSGTTYTTSSQSGSVSSASESEAESHSLSEGVTESATESASIETTQTEYIRPRFRPEDVASVFNKSRHFFYWVRRGVPPLVDFDGKPIEVQGIYTMPKHLHERRDHAPWPVLPAIQGHVVRTPSEYKSSHVVTEQSMVKQLLDTLQDPYE